MVQITSLRWIGFWQSQIETPAFIARLAKYYKFLCYWISDIVKTWLSSATVSACKISIMQHFWLIGGG